MITETTSIKTAKDFSDAKNEFLLDQNKHHEFSLWIMDTYDIHIDPISKFKLNRKTVCLDHTHPYKHKDYTQWGLIRGPLNKTTNRFEGMVFNFLFSQNYKISEYSEILLDTANGLNRKAKNKITESAERLWEKSNKNPMLM